VNRKAPVPTREAETPRPDESFFARVHRRKTEALAARQNEAATEPEATGLEPPEQVAPAALTDADMPDLSTLKADADFRGFLSPKVSETLRRAALRKLFHGPAFNVIDELDDYAEDFTTFEALGDIITADMRHQIEVEARRKAEEMKRQILETEARDDAIASDPEKARPESEPMPEDRRDVPGGTAQTTTLTPEGSVDTHHEKTHAETG